MRETVRLSHASVTAMAEAVASRIAPLAHSAASHKAALYGVPRGGVPAAYLVKEALRLHHDQPAEVVHRPSAYAFVIDDILQTGATRDAVIEQAGGKVAGFFALVEHPEQWVVFPWEGNETPGEDVVRRMLEVVGEDPSRGGLLETPARLVKAWGEWFSGYGKDPADVLKVFEDGAESSDELVLVTNIPVYSHCEHHVAPIFGVAHIGYIPNGKIVGLSKLARLTDIYARRLQVQERLTNQIADALANNLDAQGVGVVLECRHMCMESRGVCTHGTTTTTSALRGVLKTEHDARAEFLKLISNAKKGGVL